MVYTQYLLRRELALARRRRLPPEPTIWRLDAPPPRREYARKACAICGCAEMDGPTWCAYCAEWLRERHGIRNLRDYRATWHGPRHAVLRRDVRELRGEP